MEQRRGVLRQGLGSPGKWLAFGGHSQMLSARSGSAPAPPDLDQAPVGPAGWLRSPQHAGGSPAPSTSVPRSSLGHRTGQAG